MATAARSEVGPSSGHTGRRGVAFGAVAFLGMLVAAVAVWVAWGPSHIADAVPHLVAGAAALASGLYATRRTPWSRIGPLLVLMGFLWFAGDFVTCLNIEPLSHRCLRPGPVGELLGRLSRLWLGVLGHALLAFPRGRTEGAPQAAVIAAVYALALVLPANATPTRSHLVGLDGQASMGFVDVDGETIVIWVDGTTGAPFADMLALAQPVIESIRFSAPAANSSAAP